MIREYTANIDFFDKFKQTSKQIKEKINKMNVKVTLP